ncbi:hypothetical protein EBR96_09055 [bacterium]|nr:hypothetical protein [bacterium]
MAKSNFGSFMVSCPGRFGLTIVGFLVSQVALSERSEARNFFEFYETRTFKCDFGVAKLKVQARILEAGSLARSAGDPS